MDEEPELLISGRRRSATRSEEDVSSPIDLMWKPGLSRAEAKARAKEMRKFISQRSDRRDARRQAERASGERASDERSSDERFSGERATSGKRASGSERASGGERSGGVDTDTEADADADRVAGEPPALVRPCYVELLPAELWLHTLAQLGTRDLCTIAATCSPLAALASTRALWLALHARTFGTDAPAELSCDAPLPPPLCPDFVAPDLAPGLGPADEFGIYLRAPISDISARSDCSLQQARRACCESEGALIGWQRASRQMTELPLPAMTSVALLGTIGVSTHEGRLVRRLPRGSLTLIPTPTPTPT